MTMENMDAKFDSIENDDARVSSLTKSVMDFCIERDWDQFHDPKELAIGLITEASELLEIFRFQSTEQVSALLNDERSRTEIEDELADCLFFILRFAGRNGINLTQALAAKLEKTAKKYSIEKSRGNNIKYNKL
jgi:NTP pyrophosphatase (non-canonical NTP hydrolase)